MKTICLLCLYFLFSTQCCLYADKNSGLEAALLDELNTKYEQYTGFVYKDREDWQKGTQSQLKKEIISIVNSLAGEATPTVIDNLLEKYSIDEIPRSVAIQVLSEFYEPNQLNPLHTVNAKVEIALARLGHAEALGNIIKGLDLENKNLRSQAYRKLAKVRTEDSINILGSFLLGEHDKGFPASPSPGHPVGYMSSEFLAMTVLKQEFGVERSDLLKPTDVQLKDWQDWWRKGHWKDEVYSENAVADVSILSQEPQPIAITSAKVGQNSDVFVEPSRGNDEQYLIWWHWLIGAMVVLGGILVLRSRK